MFRTLLALTFALLASCAAACNNPGTPNPVFAKAISATQIQLKITNTATEGAEHQIWFLIEDPSGNVQRFTKGRILDGDFAVFTENLLRSNSQYCFHVWTRVDNVQGCRSQQPSGWVCATTQPPFATRINDTNNTGGPSTPPQPGSPPGGGGSGSSGGGGGSSGGGGGSSGSCCNEAEGSDNAHCCPTNLLVCAPPKKFYCSH